MTRRVLAVLAFAVAWVYVIWALAELLLPPEPRAPRRRP